MQCGIWPKSRYCLHSWANVYFNKAPRHNLELRATAHLLAQATFKDKDVGRTQGISIPTCTHNSTCVWIGLEIWWPELDKWDASPHWTLWKRTIVMIPHASANTHNVPVLRRGWQKIRVDLRYQTNIRPTLQGWWQCGPSDKTTMGWHQAPTSCNVGSWYLLNVVLFDGPTPAHLAVAPPTSFTHPNLIRHFLASHMWFFNLILTGLITVYLGIYGWEFINEIAPTDIA